jgi:hypothetical protein
MDPMQLTLIGIAAATTVILVRTVANVLIRRAELRHRPVNEDEQSIRERLERIELAVDTIAIEVERLGEHQRFNAQLALNRADPLRAMVITPH